MSFNKRKILSNILSLTIGESFSKLIIFIYMAYLARTISTDGFGSISFAQGLTTYLMLLTTLGLDSYGSREIAKDKSKIQYYVNTTFTIRLLFSFISYSILVIICLCLNKSIEIKHIVLISGLILFANGLLLNWVFTGIEKMNVISIRQILTSSINLIGIIVLVHKGTDTIIAVYIIAFSNLTNTLWLVIYYIRQFGMIRLNFNFSDWKIMLNSAIPIGVSFFVVSIFQATGIIMLGILNKKTMYQNAMLGAAFKINVFYLVPVSILQQSFFPILSRSNTLEERTNVLNQYTNISFIIASFLIFTFFTFSNDIVLFVWGNKYYESGLLLRYFSISVLFVYLNIVYTPSLIAWGKQVSVMYSTIAGGVVNIIANYFLIMNYGMYGATFALILTELTVCLVQAYSIKSLLSKIYILDFVRILLFTSFAFIPFYIFQIQINIIIKIIIAFILYSIVCLVFRIVKLEDVKRLFIR